MASLIMTDQSSNNDRIVEFGGFEVIYVSGERGQPIPAAFDALEARLPTLKKKRFYGVLIDGAYAPALPSTRIRAPSICRLG
jgi:hypothetical protein